MFLRNALTRSIMLLIMIVRFKDNAQTVPMSSIANTDFNAACNYTNCFRVRVFFSNFFSRNFRYIREMVLCVVCNETIVKVLIYSILKKQIGFDDSTASTFTLNIVTNKLTVDILIRPLKHLKTTQRSHRFSFVCRHFIIRQIAILNNATQKEFFE